MGFMVKKKYFKILQNVIEFLGWYKSIFLTQLSDLIFFCGCLLILVCSQKTIIILPTLNRRLGVMKTIPICKEAHLNHT